MSKAVPTAQHSSDRKTARPTWNMYLTDDDQFKLTKQELLKKKKMMISKHNILTNGGNTPVKSKVRKIKRTPKKESVDSISNNPSTKYDKVDVSGPTSLDLIGYDSESDRDSSVDSFCSPVKAVTSVTAVSRGLSPKSVSSAPTKSPSAAQSRLRSGKTKRYSQQEGQSTHSQPVRSTRSTPIEHFTMSKSDMSEIATLISSLNTELRYYEQLSGKRSALNAEVITHPVAFNRCVVLIYCGGYRNLL